MPPQPTTEQFQNELFEELTALDPSRPIWVEDESIAVGKIFLPTEFYHQMSAGPVFQVSVEKGIRIRRLVHEYGSADKEAFLRAMEGITKKLGGQHFKAAKEKLFEGDMAATIDILLNYYDKAYGTGLINKQKRIIAELVWNGDDPLECADRLIAAAAALKTNG